MKTSTVRKAMVSFAVIIFAIIAVVSYGQLSVVFANAQTNEANIKDNIHGEEKVYCDATIEDSFTDDRVLVTLMESVSDYNGLSQSAIDAIIGKIDYESVRDMSKLDDPSPALLEHLNKVGFNQMLEVRLKNKSKQNVLDTIKILEQSEAVLSVNPNYVFGHVPIIESNQEENELMTLSSIDVTPNDPKLSNQWGLTSDEGIGAQDAWKITSGSRSVRVGVIDTGIAAHEDLQANLVEGYDFYNKNSVTTDDIDKHGTQVAGVIGAVTNNGKGIAGVSPNVSIVPLQVCNGESGECIELWTVWDAIFHAINVWGTDEQISILNYSVEGFGGDDNVWQTLPLIDEFPGLFVWAAGNKGENIDELEYIGRYKLDNLISVGALQKGDDRATWGMSCDGGDGSSYGNNVTIFAPGKDIYTTEGTTKYGYVSGTSFAAPFVSGVAALVWSYRPELTAEQVKDAIKDGALPLQINTPKGVYNTRRLSALGALAATEINAKPVGIGKVTKSSSQYTWDVELTNESDMEAVITYNERMCYEGDAKNFANLEHLRSFRLPAGGEKTVRIDGNLSAGYIVASMEYPFSGKTVRIISYANGLKNGTVPTANYNAILGTSAGEVDYVPNYLGMNVVSKSGNTWAIKLTNNNPSAVSVTYNSKMCFQGAAESFQGLDHLNDITIDAYSSKNVTIQEYGTAGWITAAINFRIDDIKYRRISFGHELNKNGSMSDISTNETSVSSIFPEVSYIPSYLTLKPTKKYGLISPSWDIQITNPNGYQVQVTYNSKMCFEGDARNFKNLNNTETTTIPAYGSKTVKISGNGTAGSIMVCINYSYNGYEYRRITTAYNLAVNKCTQVNDEIRFT